MSSINLKISTDLKQARKRIEQGWTQGAFARDKNGKETYEYDLTAVKWCALGATRYGDSQDFLEAFLEQSHLAEFNDTDGRTQAEVLELFDIAIICAEASGE